MDNQKDFKQRDKKDFVPCINIEKCKGKWFKYKAKDDNGFCKACAKNETLKEQNLKINNNYQKLFDCLGTCQQKDLNFQNTDHCKARYCKRCYDQLTSNEQVLALQSSNQNSKSTVDCTSQNLLQSGLRNASNIFENSSIFSKEQINPTSLLSVHLNNPGNKSELPKQNQPFLNQSNAEISSKNFQFNSSILQTEQKQIQQSNSAFIQEFTIPEENANISSIQQSISNKNKILNNEIEKLQIQEILSNPVHSVLLQFPDQKKSAKKNTYI